MASSIDVAPTLGHPILTSQLGTGATPGYDSIDLRRVSQIGPQEGVHDDTGWKVTQHTTPGMSIDIAANVGLATVQGDAVTSQGSYVVAPHSAIANLTINAADVTNPRIDQVVLQAYDTTYDGAGNNKATMTVLTGTPTGGATLGNRNGATALPGSALRLADILVGAGVTSITNSVIRDRRPWARGACWRGISAAGNITTTASLSPIDVANLQARIECSGVSVLVTLVGTGTAGSTSDMWTGLLIDGAAAEGATSGLGWIPAASTRQIGWSYVFVPSAGSHLLAPYVQDAGTPHGVIDAQTVEPVVFGVRELVSSSANNGVA